MIFLRVPAVLSYRDLVTRAVSAACKVALGKEGTSEGGGDAFLHAMVSAVGEAFNNVVQHAHDEPAEVEIAIEVDSEAMSVEVRDSGRGFDLDAVPDPRLEDLPESGMGLFIIRAFVDEVRYQRGSPNVLFMKKRLA
jgi:serine/threonine-protein kinase RsbW